MIAALNKYYRPVSKREYWHEWGLPETENACVVAGIPEHLIDKIWIYERGGDGFGVHFDEPVRR